MFTKEDYLEYFEQIAAVERAMIYSIEDVLCAVDDEALSGQLKTIAQDEIRHYLYIKGVFDSVFFNQGGEGRRFLREHALGKVKLKPMHKDITIEGYCVNFSQGGICVECDRDLDLSDEMEVWVDFFDKQRASKHAQGELVWSVKIAPELSMGKITYKAGIEFKSKPPA